MKHSLTQMACKFGSFFYKDLLLPGSELKGFCTLILMSPVSGERRIWGGGGKKPTKEI